MYANDSAIKINNFPFYWEYGRYWGLYCGKRAGNGARNQEIWSCYFVILMQTRDGLFYKFVLF